MARSAGVGSLLREPLNAGMPAFNNFICASRRYATCVAATLPRKRGRDKKELSHAAFPIAATTGSVFMSRIFTRALITPLRPSSNVTSVEISASLEPS